MALNHTQLIRPLAVALVTAAVAAPAASARVNSDARVTQPTSSSNVTTAPPQSTTVVKSSGFDWGDAGIGAGAALALVVTGLGARIAVGHRGQSQANRARPTISAT